MLITVTVGMLTSLHTFMINGQNESQKNRSMRNCFEQKLFESEPNEAQRAYVYIYEDQQTKGINNIRLTSHVVVSLKLFVWQKETAYQNCECKNEIRLDKPSCPSGVYAKFGLLPQGKVSSPSTALPNFFCFTHVCSVFVFPYHRLWELLFYDRWIWGSLTCAQLWMRAVHTRGGLWVGFTSTNLSRL